MTIGNDSQDNFDASISPENGDPAKSIAAGFCVEGRVLDDAGNPCRNAVVSIIAGPAPNADIAAVTDDAGTFSLAVQIAGSYWLAVRIDGVLHKQIEVTLPALETFTLEIRLSR